MSQTESIWIKIQLKCRTEKFYDFFRNHFGDLVNIFPQQFKSFQFVEGDNFDAGNVVLLKYEIGSEFIAAKIKIKVVDDVKQYIIYQNLDGDLVKPYKLFRVKLEVFNGASLSKVGGGSFAKWTVEFEKANENVPPPESHLEMFAKMSKGIDAYFSKN
uniref:Major latex-like protein n=1 Tax=Luffa aegyptiaca TaxID=3670 RepID=A0A1V1FLY6_LUFAE|nr:major latex-like protein [Luffa aegyptiaca]